MTVIDPKKSGNGAASRTARARWRLELSMDPVDTPAAPEAKPSRLRVFAYLNADNAPLYRAIMGAFMRGKERFALHLRPAEARAALFDSGHSVSLEQVEAALKQLRQWGNLRADPDTAEVATVEEFYRERLLYQLTKEGEAAERAVQLFEEHIQRPGELQTAALDDIHELLRGLHGLATQSAVDSGKIFNTLRLLCTRFEELTDRAQTFMRSLRRSIDLHGEQEVVLLGYKERLIDYLERFLRRLLVASEDIADTLRDIDRIGVEPLLEAAVQHELIDRLDGGADEQAVAWRRWRGRWSGLRRWFIGTAGERSQAEVLRAHARSAIPALLQAINRLHDRRVNRTDRFNDLRTLARWFAQAPSDRQAHRLWRVAFGLVSARHLRVDETTLARWDQQAVAPSTSWLDAPALQLAPRLRKTGRYTRRGRPNSVIDRSKDRQRLAQMAEVESRQIQHARQQLATGRRSRLSDIGALEPAAFDLFLDLLGEALSRQRSPLDTVTTCSSDGVIEIVLEPIEGSGEAVIETSAGQLRGRDYWVTMTDLTQTVADDGHIAQSQATQTNGVSA